MACFTRFRESSLVSKNVDIPLDYYVFASDLYLLQFDVTRDGVLARWAKDYYLYHSASNDAEAQTAAD